MAKKRKYRYVVQIIIGNHEALFEKINTDFPWKIAHRGNLYFEAKEDSYDLIEERVKALLNVKNEVKVYEIERFEMKTVEVSASIVFVDEAIKSEDVIMRYSSEPVDYFDDFEVYPNTKVKNGEYMLLVKNRETQEERWMEVDAIFDFFFEIFRKREERKLK